MINNLLKEVGHLDEECMKWELIEGTVQLFSSLVRLGERG
jgi:hypothetical protein